MIFINLEVFFKTLELLSEKKHVLKLIEIRKAKNNKNADGRDCESHSEVVRKLRLVVLGAAMVVVWKKVH